VGTCAIVRLGMAVNYSMYNYCKSSALCDMIDSMTLEYQEQRQHIWNPLLLVQRTNKNNLEIRERSRSWVRIDEVKVKRSEAKEKHEEWKRGGAEGMEGTRAIGGGWTEREEARSMLSWGKRGREGKMLGCESFLSHLFKDAFFPPECEDRIKIKTSSSSNIKFPSTQIVF